MYDPIDRQLSDRRLVVDAQNGDFEAFRQIVLRYSNALLSVAYSVVGDFHEAQDVTQEAFVKCYRTLHTLHDPEKLGSWLYSITYRTSLDFVKKKKAALPLDENKLKADAVDDWLEQHIIQDTVWKAIRALEEKSRTTIVLHYLSGWTMKEIGSFLDLSVAAVESRIRRARETLKLHLSADFEHYFQPYKLGSDFEQVVSEQVLKRMGHFYIPVSNKEQSREWFMQHFNLELSAHGNLYLESGEELYLLECQQYIPSNAPLLTFTVSSIGYVWQHLKTNGITIESIECHELFGSHFVFYDPDGNKYSAIEAVGESPTS